MLPILGHDHRLNLGITDAVTRVLYDYGIELEEVEVWMAWARATPEMAQRPYALLRDLFSYRFAIRDSDSPIEARAKLERGIAEWMGPVGVADPPPRRHSDGATGGNAIPMARGGGLTTHCEG